MSDSFIIAAAQNCLGLAPQPSSRAAPPLAKFYSSTVSSQLRGRRHLPQTSPCDLVEKMRAVSPLLDVTSNAGLTEQPSSGQNIPGS